MQFILHVCTKPNILRQCAKMFHGAYKRNVPRHCAKTFPAITIVCELILNLLLQKLSLNGHDSPPPPHT